MKFFSYDKHNILKTQQLLYNIPNFNISKNQTYIIFSLFVENFSTYFQNFLVIAYSNYSIYNIDQY